jgi:hypothetical protein
MPDESIEERVQEEVTRRLAHRSTHTFHRTPSLFQVISLAIVLLVPMAGWTMNLSNRVAVLELQTNDLHTAATQIAALTQQVSDFQKEWEEWKQAEARPQYISPSHQQFK